MACALARVVEALESIAPLRLAAEWDNVGLLVDHARPRRVSRCLLAIDLTEAVLDEALTGRCELIVAYHPPIFAAVKRLDSRSARQRTILRAIRQGIAIHSPHTALDATAGGVNDWLADGLGAGRRTSLEPTPAGGGQRLVATVPAAGARALADALTATGAEVEIDGTEDAVTVIAHGGGDPARRVLGDALQDDAATRSSILELVPRLTSRTGQGRLVTLAKPAALATVVRRIKRHLGLDHVRVAAAPGGAPIRTVALCPGAGGSVLLGVTADLLWTGEMRHHDVLAALERGANVVLCEHSNTERGYLPQLAERLHAALDGAVEVRVSATDREPLRVI